MAIAALVVETREDNMEDVLRALRAMPPILEANPATASRIGAALETPASNLLDSLRACKNLSGVIDIELVYVNYEDDIDACGFIECGSYENILRKLQSKQ